VLIRSQFVLYMWHCKAAALCQDDYDCTLLLYMCAT